MAHAQSSQQILVSASAKSSACYTFWLVYQYQAWNKMNKMVMGHKKKMQRKCLARTLCHLAKQCTFGKGHCSWQWTLSKRLHLVAIEHKCDRLHVNETIDPQSSSLCSQWCMESSFQHQSSNQTEKKPTPITLNSPSFGSFQLMLGRLGNASECWEYRRNLCLKKMKTNLSVCPWRPLKLWHRGTTCTLASLAARSCGCRNICCDSTCSGLVHSPDLQAWSAWSKNCASYLPKPEGPGIFAWTN